MSRLHEKKPAAPRGDASEQNLCPGRMRSHDGGVPGGSVECAEAWLREHLLAWLSVMSELPRTDEQKPTRSFDPAPSERANDPSLPGTEQVSAPMPTKLGHYPVRRRLGAGGYGTVYEAFDERMQRPVAIKVPSVKLLDSQRAREEFLREARSVARLRHECIVTAHEFGEDPGGECFIVYEYVDGSTLSARAKAARIAQVEAAEIIAQVADALHYAHQQGVIHRDIKPSNILLDQRGRPRISCSFCMPCCGLHSTCNCLRTAS